MTIGKIPESMRILRMAKAHRNAYVYLSSSPSVCFGNYFVAGISYVEDNYRIDRPDSDWTIIEYVLQGQGRLVAPDGQEYLLNRGDSYCLPRGIHHQYYSEDSQEQWAKIYINFGGGLFVHLLHDFGIDTHYVYPALNIHEELLQIYELVKTGGLHTERECSALIFRILYKMQEVVFGLKEEPSDAASLKHYIDLHYTEKLEMSDLSKLLYKSPSQVIRIFRQAYDITPHQYLLQKKIAAAKVLLKTTHLTIKSIAESLSFADEFYFSNVFKRYTGFSPGEYRHIPESQSIT